MKVIEKILLEINDQNLAESLDKIQTQIKLFAKNKKDVDGTSLMLVRDLLDPSYTDKMLRDNGYILTVAQFKEDSEKFIKSDKKDPFYRPRLKRLHNSYMMFRESYVKGGVRTKAVVDEMTKRFSEVILSVYCGHDDTSKMPKELSSKIGKMIETEIEQLNDKWLHDKLSQETKKEFNDLLSTHLHKDWQMGHLDASVRSILQEEKDRVNSTEALLAHFANKKLPEDTQSLILEAVIEEIKNEIAGAKLTANSPLGSAINFIRNNSLLTDHSVIISKVVSNWQNQKTSADVSKQIEKYLTNVISKMKTNLESRLTQQFEQLATQIFTEKLCAGEYNNKQELLDVIKKHTLSIAKQLLLSSESEVSAVTKCKEAIHKDVMYQLHNDWIANRLTSAENDFIQENVFSFLDDVEHRIQETLWLADTKQKVEQLTQENQDLQKEMKELKQLVGQLQFKFADRSKVFDSAASGVKNEKEPVGSFFKI